MGSDSNYVVVEPSSDADPDAIEDALREGRVFDQRVGRHDGSVVGFGLGAEDPALDRLEAVAADVERALLVHVYDTTRTGVGTLYDADGDDLVEVECLKGSERSGIDVFDYFTREHAVDAPR